MVLWEITLGTAYFLGLKRTYRLALKIQRRVISAKHPKIRQFFHGRTRAIFDAALKVHRNIQERDIEVGRNLGNWILRWLDRMKPSAQIRASKPPDGAASSRSMTKEANNASHMKTPGSNQNSRNQESGRHLFASSRNLLPKSLPTIAMMMQPPRPAGTFTQYRHMCNGVPQMMWPNYKIGAIGYGGVFRKDVMQYILQN